MTLAALILAVIAITLSLGTLAFILAVVLTRK
jgi:hypothetical protein